MQGFCLWRRYYISIHALLAESDNLCFVSACWWRDFYPRSPCGERLTNDEIFAVDCRFLSTLSLRRATERLEKSEFADLISIHALLAESDLSNTVLFESPICISIHALLAESDRIRARIVLHEKYFYPRSPCGERLPYSATPPCPPFISIHALLAESDVGIPNANTDKKISIHALLAESDALSGATNRK